MFREMRRRRQQLSPEECKRILAEGTSGVLAVRGDEGYPYAVPLSYVYEEGRLFFHGAAAGHRRDAVLRDPKASFCVIGGDRVVPEEYTTYFRSVIAFGQVPVLEDDDIDALEARIHETEHIIYPEVLRAIAEGRMTLDADRKIHIRSVD